MSTHVLIIVGSVIEYIFSGGNCATFWHKMDIQSTGALRVYQRLEENSDVVRNRLVAWENTFNQDPYWRFAYAEMFATDITWRIEFESESGTVSLTGFSSCCFPRMFWALVHCVFAFL